MLPFLRWVLHPHFHLHLHLHQLRFLLLPVLLYLLLLLLLLLDLQLLLRRRGLRCLFAFVKVGAAEKTNASLCTYYR